MRSETVSDLRQRLALFIREVNYTKNPIVIMQHGSPVALLSPLPPEMMGPSLPVAQDESDSP